MKLCDDIELLYYDNDILATKKLLYFNYLKEGKKENTKSLIDFINVLEDDEKVKFGEDK